MVILDNRPRASTIKLDDTAPGEVFEYMGTLYLRLKSMSDGRPSSINLEAKVVNLKDSSLHQMPRKNDVILVSASIHINHKAGTR